MAAPHAYYQHAPKQQGRCDLSANRHEPSQQRRFLFFSISTMSGFHFAAFPDCLRGSVHLHLPSCPTKPECAILTPVSRRSLTDAYLDKAESPKGTWVNSNHRYKANGVRKGMRFGRRGSILPSLYTTPLPGLTPLSAVP